LRILVTSGASCPDAMVEGVIRKIQSYYGNPEAFEAVVDYYNGL